jgi:hypothetical protein
MAGNAPTLDTLLSLGRNLFALRQVLRGTGDARLAMQYLFFHADVNDPQVTPLLTQHGVDEEIAPAIEDYVCTHLRPWMRRIDRGSGRAASWADGAIRELTSAIGSTSELEERALRILTEELETARPGDLERWRVALEDGDRPDPGADRLLGAIGLLQECCGITVSTTAELPWGIRRGDRP